MQVAHQTCKLELQNLIEYLNNGRAVLVVKGCVAHIRLQESVWIESASLNDSCAVRRDSQALLS